MSFKLLSFKELIHAKLLHAKNTPPIVYLKDFKLFWWSFNFVTSLRAMEPIQPQEDLFFDNLERFLKKQNIHFFPWQFYTEWFFHLAFFRVLDSMGWLMKHSAYMLPCFFFDDSQDSRNDLADSWWLEIAFFKAITYWFAFPVLINDFYKHASQNNFSLKLVHILFEYWIQLPEVIIETYEFLIKYYPELLITNYLSTWEPWNGKEPFFEKMTPSFNYFSYTLPFFKAPDKYYPNTKKVLEVYNKTQVLPTDLFELMALYESSFKDVWEEEFKYFFKYFELNKQKIKTIKFSESLSKLLIYNPPMPLSVLKAMYPPTDEANIQATEEYEEEQRRILLSLDED